MQADKIRSIVRFVDTLTLEADDEMGIPSVLHGSLQGVLLISHYEDLFLCNPRLGAGLDFIQFTRILLW